jgi:hypothetical protein
MAARVSFIVAELNAEVDFCVQPVRRVGSKGIDADIPAYEATLSGRQKTQRQLMVGVA